MEMLKNPFQMLPFRADDLKDSKQKIYTTQRCETSNITENDVQQMYNRIRVAGGLWIDPNVKNLGYVKKNIDTKLLQNDVDFFTINNDFKKNDSNYYITDFEDLIFLTPELIQKYIDESGKQMTLPYGNLEGGTIHNKIFLKGISSIENIQEIYEKRFIMRSQTLLKYEKQYQLQKGNKKSAKRCERILKTINKAIEQDEYVAKQYYKFGRVPNRVKNKWNIKEIGIRVMQQTRVSKLKDMVPIIKQKLIRKDYERKLDQIAFEPIQENIKKRNAENDPFRTADADTYSK